MRVDSTILQAGVDEAGRGPLAGSVVAAAVILHPDHPISGLADSKALSAVRREYLAAIIKGRALAWSIAEASVAEIDRLNILQATMLAMCRALECLCPAPQRALIDGNRVPDGLHCTAEPVIGGDRTIPAISAASILAKTARDAQLLQLAREYPEYGFERHKGYGTRDHLAALQRFGPTPAHRRSFAPVHRLLISGDSS